MQVSQVKEQFPGIARSIDHASQLCQTTDQVPDDLRNCIALLDEESDQARQRLSQESDEDEIRECILKLKKLGDQARKACKVAGDSVDEDVQVAVRQAHDAIADLKIRIH